MHPRQLPCWITFLEEAGKTLIRDNLASSAMYGGALDKINSGGLDVGSNCFSNNGSGGSAAGDGANPRDVTDRSRGYGLDTGSGVSGEKELYDHYVVRFFSAPVIRQARQAVEAQQGLQQVRLALEVDVRPDPGAHDRRTIALSGTFPAGLPLPPGVALAGAGLLRWRTRRC